MKLRPGEKRKRAGCLVSKSVEETEPVIVVASATGWLARD
jgi:hypothetical protein